jgi:hypothetical protein
LKEGKKTQLALYKCSWFTRESKEAVCLGTAEKFQILRAMYDQPKKYFVIRGFV